MKKQMNKNLKTKNTKSSAKYKKARNKAEVKDSYIKYTTGQIGKIEVVKDFLPAPDELVLKDSTVRITLNLSKTSVEFFKDLAQKNGSQYQRVIRNLLDQYSAIYTK